MCPGSSFLATSIAWRVANDAGIEGVSFNDTVAMVTSLFRAANSGGDAARRMVWEQPCLYMDGGCSKVVTGVALRRLTGLVGRLVFVRECARCQSQRESTHETRSVRAPRACPRLLQVARGCWQGHNLDRCVIARYELRGRRARRSAGVATRTHRGHGDDEGWVSGGPRSRGRADPAGRGPSARSAGPPRAPGYRRRAASQAARSP